MKHQQGRTAHHVAIVGVGPGDPRLMTRRASRALADANLVLCHPGIDPRVVEYAAPSAEVHWADRLPDDTVSQASAPEPPRRYL